MRWKHCNWFSRYACDICRLFGFLFVLAFVGVAGLVVVAVVALADAT